jgi:hypothetical protein
MKQVEIRLSGKNTLVPAAEVCGRTVVARGGYIKIASVHDEVLAEGELVKDPEAFVAALKQSGLKADVLTFFQRPPDVTPKFHHHFDWDNYAVVDTSNFDAWWEKLPQEARKNTRRSAKRGVIVKTVPYDDALAQGIHKLCNESPVRQGKPFWHYGKDFETVKREHGTFPERSEFVAAYFQDELIGFIKMVYTDRQRALRQTSVERADHQGGGSLCPKGRWLFRLWQLRLWQQKGQFPCGIQTAKRL